MCETNDVTIARSREAGTAKRAECSSQLSVAVSSGSKVAALPSVAIIGHCCFVTKWLPLTADRFTCILFENIFRIFLLCVAVSIVRGIRSSCPIFRSANFIALYLFVMLV